MDAMETLNLEEYVKKTPSEDKELLNLYSMLEDITLWNEHLEAGHMATRKRGKFML